MIVYLSCMRTPQKGSCKCPIYQSWNGGFYSPSISWKHAFSLARRSDTQGVATPCASNSLYAFTVFWQYTSF